MKIWNARKNLAFFDLFSKKGLNYYEITSDLKIIAFNLKQRESIYGRKNPVSHLERWGFMFFGWTPIRYHNQCQGCDQKTCTKNDLVLIFTVRI